MAKKKQPLMRDLEQGIEQAENETRYGNLVRRRDSRFHGPQAPKPDSYSKLEISGLWASSINTEYCCIYRVPNRLRRVNPEAYTPQMLLIGPLQHSKKKSALELSKTDSRYLDYMSMEAHKVKYLHDITNKCGVHIVDELRRIIKQNEKNIRESYSELTDWIESQEFVEMILLDSVFIIGFFFKIENITYQKIGEDILFNEVCLITTIFEDLILLENQLPYTLLEELSDLLFLSLGTTETFRDIVVRAFRLEDNFKEGMYFRHFTDLFRRVLVGLLTKEEIKRPKSIKSLHNADKLDSAGVDFVHQENELSLVITFERGILKIPRFVADDDTERVMRNLMALEQCHYPVTAYVCNYIAFLDLLIDTEQDVDLLVKKGVVVQQASVAEMVKKLNLGLVDLGSHYSDIAKDLNKYYESRFVKKEYYVNRLNKSVATLGRVYFKDLWTGTATVAAVIILVLTFIGTVASVLQVTQKDNNPTTKSLPPPPPAPKH